MAVLLNLLAIFSITFLVANLFLSALFALTSQQLLRVEVSSRKLLLWLIALLPWFISLLLTVYINHSYHNPDPFSDITFPHWHHMTDFQWYSWHGFSLVMCLAYLALVLVKQAKTLYLHHRELASLSDFSSCQDDGVYVIESNKSYAFTSGFINKKCFVTTGLQQQTTDEEYQVVIDHEKAHIRANDPLKKWLFSLLSCFYIRAIATRLKLHMVLAMEQKADEGALISGVSKLFVASTLVKVAKLNAQSGLIKQSELVVNFGADVLEQRVYFLLDKLNLEPVPKWITGVLILLLVAVSMTSIDGIHHFMETLFSH